MNAVPKSVATQQDLSVEDLIEEEDLVVTISHQGYGKTQPLDMLPGAAPWRPR